MSYMLSLQNMYLSRDIFTIIKKRLNYYSKLNFRDSSICYRRKGNVSARKSGKKVIARTNNYSKSDSGKGSRGSNEVLNSPVASRSPRREQLALSMYAILHAIWAHSPFLHVIRNGNVSGDLNPSPPPLRCVRTK